MGKMFGIDLGTTNSAMSIYTGNNTSKIVVLENGKTTMPSCVMWKGGEEWVVGEEAYNHRYEENVCYSIKKKMGTDYKAVFKHEGEERELTPVQVSTLIIKELVDRAKYLYPEVKDVTITVPADFGAAQREDTKEAGEALGLNVVAIISEPTSAALCYESDEETKDVVVYDLGGGTFDVSVVRMEKIDSNKGESTSFNLLGVSLEDDTDEGEVKRRYEVLVSEGDKALGGDDVDGEILKIIMKKYNQQNNRGRTDVEKIQDILTTAELESLKLRLEQHKKGLDSGNVRSVMMRARGEEIQIEVKEEDVAEATRRIYNKTRLIMGRALANNKVDRSDIKEIILVGGSTKSSLLQKFIRDSYPEMKVSSALNPDEAIAKGASLQTAVTMGESTTSIMDVSPYTISVETLNETVTGEFVAGRTIPLIKKNTLLPVRITRAFDVQNNGNDLEVKLYMGENVLTSELTNIARIVLETDEIDERATLIVTIDSNGIFKIKVKNGENEKEVEVLNILGTALKETKVSPYLRLTTRWRSLLESRGIKIEGDLEKAFNKFEENGDAGARGIIQKSLNDTNKEELNRQHTSLFRKEEEVEQSEERFE